MAEFKCLKCKRYFDVDDDLADKVWRCPFCEGTSFAWKDSSNPKITNVEEVHLPVRGHWNFSHTNYMEYDYPIRSFSDLLETIEDFFS